ncbi:MAG: cation diffusion facilitator family transporter [Oscillospiraceae bacterium]|jgi:cobalt-zinc-cadmium efflux system protein|nr:cation diffusion facilitator family transporter [Oscillospiraceae bacterium]
MNNNIVKINEEAKQIQMNKNAVKNIGWALVLNFIFLAIEIIGGFFTHSMAVVSDAIHDSGDLFAIGIAWVAEKVAGKRPNERYTYGYMRFSFLGALVNSLMLLGTSLLILKQALSLLFVVQEVDHDGMVFLALLGILFKGFAVLKTAKGCGIGEKAVNLHLLLDVLNWIAVLFVGVFIKIFNVEILDPILSLGIVGFILVGVVKNLKKIFEVLLERAPKSVDITRLKKELLVNCDISNVHHIHIWVADGLNTYSTLHVLVKDDLKSENLSCVKKYVREVMKRQDIGHVTVELEFESEGCKEDNCEFEMGVFDGLNVEAYCHNHRH